MERVETLILGAGVAGLAAAWEFGDQAAVLESQARPGGLVQSVRLGDYWFDRVLHLLYFNSPQTEERIRKLLGDSLAPCPPIAWVQTAHGVARFPLQLHLAGLERETIVEAICDIAKVANSPRNAAANFEEILLQSFGRKLCDLFFYPYNRKVWKRPLSSLAASGFTWNIVRPDFATVVRGAISPVEEGVSYNAKGWYPRPHASSEIRGMEVLSHALGQQAADLRLNHKVIRINLRNRRVIAATQRGPQTFEFQSGCISTLPLTKMLSLCEDAPQQLRDDCSKLLRNRVFTGMFAIEGPRPCGRGHWQYYADESLIFTRVVYMHEFDPLTAPPNGWGLLVEITEPAEAAALPDEAILDRIETDLQRAGVVDHACRITARQLALVDPAYVVFTNESMEIVKAAREFLEEHDVNCLGRYGRWEYSSMSQVMTDGFELGRRLRNTPPESVSQAELPAAPCQS